MGFLKEFKDFAMKGNLVDIAVGFVMGAAFKEVVSSFTGGIVSPLIGLLFNSDFNDLKYVITEGTPNDAGEIVGEIAGIVRFVLNQCYRFYYRCICYVPYCKRRKQNEEKRGTCARSSKRTVPRGTLGRNPRFIEKIKIVGAENNSALRYTRITFKNHQCVSLIHWWLFYL